MQSFCSKSAAHGGFAVVLLASFASALLPWMVLLIG